MNSGSRDADRILSLIQRVLARGGNLFPAKEPPFDPEDGGVPPAMWDGEPDREGWVRWKPIDSAVSEDDLHRLEQRIGVPLPTLVRAWLSAACIGPLEMRSARLPPLWSDGPLREFEQAIESWSPLERAKFIVIGEANNDAGPLCLDLGFSGRDPVVAFDHERLFELGPGRVADRLSVAPLAQPCWDSFAQLLDALDGSA